MGCPYRSKNIFFVTIDPCELTGSNESTESSTVDRYVSVGTEFEISDGIRLIAMKEMSIDPEGDSEWSSREYFDSPH